MKAMPRAKGAKLGITTTMTPKEARKDIVPDIALRALGNSAPSSVPMSAVKRFSMRPIGVLSKNDVGARETRLSIAMNI